MPNFRLTSIETRRQTRAMWNEAMDDQRGQGQETTRRLLDLITGRLASGEERPVTNQLIEDLRARSFTDE